MKNQQTEEAMNLTGTNSKEMNLSILEEEDVTCNKSKTVLLTSLIQ